MKDSLAKIILFVFVAWMAYGTLSDYTPSPSDRKELQKEASPYNIPVWATFIILCGTGYTFWIIYQSKSKVKRDKEFARLLKEADGKIEKTTLIDDEAGRDIMVKKGGKIWMTMDTNKLKDIE